jgi:hypothetical protein
VTLTEFAAANSVNVTEILSIYFVEISPHPGRFFPAGMSAQPR